MREKYKNFLFFWSELLTYQHKIVGVSDLKMEIRYIILVTFLLFGTVSR